MLKKSNEQYVSWISDLKQKIQQSQIKAAIQVNSALIEMYWELGKEISERNFENTYGSGFFLQLSKDLRTEFPEIKAFSESNLKYCKRFYLFYHQNIENRQQVVDDLENNISNKNIFLIPWGHQVILMTKCKTADEAHFYIKKTIENGCSRAVLLNMISGKLIESQGKPSIISQTHFLNTNAI